MSYYWPLNFFTDFWVKKNRFFQHFIEFIETFPRLLIVSISNNVGNDYVLENKNVAKNLNGSGDCFLSIRIVIIHTFCLYYIYKILNR